MLWLEGIQLTFTWGDLDWGTVPTWAGSALTSVSIFIAALAYRRNVMDKEADQARNVYAWTDESPDHGNGGERLLRVRNGSDSIVYSIEVHPFGGPLTEIPELPPKAEYHLRVPVVDRAGLKSAFRLTYPTFVLSLTTGFELYRVEPFPLLRFRDAAGRWWQRDGRGKLKHAPRGPRPKRLTYSIDSFGFNLVELVIDYEAGTLDIRRRKKSK